MFDAELEGLILEVAEGLLALDSHRAREIVATIDYLYNSSTNECDFKTRCVPFWITLTSPEEEIFASMVFASHLRHDIEKRAECNKKHIETIVLSHEEWEQFKISGALDFEVGKDPDLVEDNPPKKEAKKKDDEDDDDEFDYNPVGDEGWLGAGENRDVV